MTVAMLVPVLSGGLVAVAGPARAGTAGAEVCTPSATVTAVEPTWGSSISSVDRLRTTVRKKNRMFRARATATVGVSANLMFEVSGLVDRCPEGVSTPEPVTVTMTEETSRSYRRSAVARHRTAGTARKVAGRRAVRAAERAGRAIFEVLEAAGRPHAQAELAKQLGPAGG